MKKIIISVITILVVVAALIVGFKLTQSNAGRHMTLAQAESQAREQTNLPACLNTPSQHWPNDEDGTAISDVVGAKLTDRPKNIVYSLNFESFSPEGATGTIVYDGTSGDTFNFIVVRANNNSVWKLTSFHACR